MIRLAFFEEKRYNLFCMQYFVIEVGGRQYLVKPEEVIETDKLSVGQKTFTVDKVLLAVNDDKIRIGFPYIADALEFEVLGDVNKPKIRVSKYKPKANYRRVIGQKRTMTRIKLLPQKETVKTDA